MRLSNRFKELRGRLRELRLHLLPANFSPTGDYTDRQQDRARGYRLLVHAEIESYLEDVSRETVTQAIRDWKTSNKPSNIIVSFLAAYHSSWSVTEEIKNEELIQIAKSRKNAKDSVVEVIDLAQRQFTKKLKDNHGIKDKNFKTLILPTGIDIGSLDQTWLTNIDSFGTKRGEVAHKAKRTQGTINPKDEFESVQALLNGLEDLDKKIMQLRSENA
ncbi:hypothetical protein KO507_16950 [Gilvimarinus agarilyticus]|uniref:HEPN domain-containing protein n=1 Tax=Gilvimarinus sp. 2_MG-2023 TaxID=3062666 RepID=UPI001C0A586A|nr:HEPN domain-containing protein [Gilvimarinus sp. 2_MG-2023]MBU2887457.1 hypothetical protein [Gilvimarinus agarilyticus]MDO6572116.1 HEPN domain-containing protein [Gilvimarinus sp. 2_MG-2023]